VCIPWLGKVFTVFAFEVVQNDLWLHIINTMEVFKWCMKNMVYVGNIEVMIVSNVCQRKFYMRTVSQS
jgi:hypothetical protein